jgi:hypothetical protein
VERNLNSEVRAIFLTMQEHSLAQCSYMGLGFVMTIVLGAVVIFTAAMAFTQGWISGSLAVPVASALTVALFWIGHKMDMRTRDRKLAQVRQELNQHKLGVNDHQASLEGHID